MEEWRCPKCGHLNEYYSGFCVKCTELRPADQQVAGTETAASATGPAVASAAAAPTSTAPKAAVSKVSASDSAPTPQPCQICGRTPGALFNYQANKGFLFTRQVSSFEGCLCRTCAEGMYRTFQARNLSWGWYGMISFLATIIYAVQNAGERRRGRRGLAAPTPSDPATERTLLGKPLIVRLLPGLGVIAAIIAVIGGIAFASGDGKGSAVADEYQGLPVSLVDGAYINDFVDINDARNDLIDLANSRTDAWTKESPSSLPQAKYLVVDEVASFLTQMEAMASPVTEELQGLHQAWLTSVQEVVAAEETLATEPTAANLRANNQAWGDEYAAYSSVFEYCKAHYEAQ